jgi:hypothetical protein
MNVVILNILPIRHDLTQESRINKEITEKNVDINKILKRLPNAKVDISNVSTAHHTRHEQPVKRICTEYPT